MACTPGSTGNGSIESAAVGSAIGHIHIADPFAGEGQGFGIGVAHHRIRINMRNPGSSAAVSQLPVGLIGDDVDGMAKLLCLFLQQGSQLFQGLHGIHHAGGIVGRIQDQGGGIGIQAFFQFRKVDLEAGHIRLHYPKFQACLLGKGLVFGEIRGNSQKFAFRHGQSPHHSHQLRRSTAADEEILRPGIGLIAGI